jgi:hypothetical protein
VKDPCPADGPGRPPVADRARSCAALGLRHRIAGCRPVIEHGPPGASALHRAGIEQDPEVAAGRARPLAPVAAVHGLPAVRPQGSCPTEGITSDGAQPFGCAPSDRVAHARSAPVTSCSRWWRHSPRRRSSFRRAASWCRR